MFVQKGAAVFNEHHEKYLSNVVVVHAWLHYCLLHEHKCDRKEPEKGQQGLKMITK